MTSSPIAHGALPRGSGDRIITFPDVTTDMLNGTLPKEEVCCPTNRTSLISRINKQVDRWKEVETNRKLAAPKVVWTERAIVVLAAAGIALTAAGKIALPLIILGLSCTPLALIGVALGICLLAYLCMRLKISRDVNNRYEPERKLLLALEEAMAKKSTNQRDIKKLVNAYLQYLVNRGEKLNPRDREEYSGPEPEFDSVTRLIHQLPGSLRQELLKDIVIGSRNDDLVLHTHELNKPSKESALHDEFGLVKRLVKTQGGRRQILENRNLENQYLDYCRENARTLNAEERSFYTLLIKLRESPGVPDTTEAAHKLVAKELRANIKSCFPWL